MLTPNSDDNPALVQGPGTALLHRVWFSWLSLSCPHSAVLCTAGWKGADNPVVLWLLWVLWFHSILHQLR